MRRADMRRSFTDATWEAKECTLSPSTPAVITDLPEPYRGIASSVAKVARREGMIDKLDLGKHAAAKDCRHVTLIATTAGQLVALFGNFVCFCLDVPFDDACRLGVEPDFHDDDVLALLVSPTTGCCVVSMCGRKILGHWTNASDVFVEDYLGVGHDQVVVVFTTGPTSRDFLVTDFRCCHADTRSSVEASADDAMQEEDLEVVDSPVDGLSSVVDSLTLRLQGLHNVLTEKRSKLDDKKSVISSSLRNMTRLTLGQPLDVPRDTSSSLIDMISSVACSNNLGWAGNEGVSVPITIKDVWKRVCYEKLVVGLEFEMVAGHAPLNLSAGLIGPQFQSSKCVLRQHGSREVTSLEGSRLKMAASHDSSVILMVSELPTFRSLEVATFSVLLTWDVPSSDGVERSLAGCRSYSSIVAAGEFTCGDAMSSSLDFRRRFVEQSRKDLLAYEAASVSRNCRLTSRVTDLTDLPVRMCLALSLSDVEHAAGTSIVRCSRFPGSEYRLTCSRQGALVSIFGRDERIVGALECSLRRVLPADVEVSMASDKARALATVCSCLKAELSSALETPEALGGANDASGSEFRGSIGAQCKRKRDSLEDSDVRIASGSDQSHIEQISETNMRFLELLTLP